MDKDYTPFLKAQKNFERVVLIADEIRAKNKIELLIKNAWEKTFIKHPNTPILTEEILAEFINQFKIELAPLISQNNKRLREVGNIQST